MQTHSLRTFSVYSTFDPAIGTTWTSQGYIRVQFSWLAAPLAMWLFATLFLAATVWESARRDVPLWKSSALAVLRSQDYQRGGGGAPPAARAARKTLGGREARLAADEKGNWRLVATEARRGPPHIFLDGRVPP
ncbi:MAG: hypothetical protein INR71_14115 [Terriglobus roseus]|nr:hypothetical protein [Terriglobus roseus]